MGRYGEVDIIATFETTEQADRVIDNLENNVKQFIENKLDGKPFHFYLNEIDLDDTFIIIKICSDRYQNAEWQGEQTFAYLKTTNGLIEFTAEILMPENFLWWSIDEEE